MYESTDPKTGTDLWILPLEGERKPVPFLKREFNEQSGQFSPDGHWVAYTSDESGRGEIYVAPFPGSGGKHQVSLAGGEQPRWRADGKKLFYIAPDNRLMAAEIGIKGAEVEIGAVRTLLDRFRPAAATSTTFPPMASASSRSCPTTRPLPSG